MLLSSYLTSSYLQYKEDTNAVASWLATTAKKCGYAADLLTKNDKRSSQGKQQQPSQSARLKGKARKADRQAKAVAGRGAGETAIPGNKDDKANDSASTTTRHKGPTYTIAIKDFGNLAEWIASYEKPPVRVPTSFVAAVTRAIAVRREHGAQVPGNDEKADQRHGYFIGVLEHVRDVLRPRMPSELRKAAEEAMESGSTNVFEALQVHEPSEEFLRAPGGAAAPAATKKATADVEANYEAEQLQDMQEAFVAFRLLTGDYNRFCALIQQTWDGYRQGIHDLISASVMTNTALDLARRMEDEAKPLFDKFGGSERMLQMYYLGLCIEMGEGKDDTEQPGDDMNFRMYDAAMTIFWPAYQFLQAFLKLEIGPRNLPQYKPGYYGVYDPTSDRSKKTAREKFQEDKIILTENLPDFCVLCMGAEYAPAEDEFTRGLRTAFNTKHIPLSLVFAAQVYLDIHSVLRDKVDRGWSDLHNAGRLIDNSIELTFNFHASLRVDTWPRAIDEAFRHIQGRIDWWVRNDPIIAAKQRLGRPPGKPFHLFKSHPLYCGLALCSLKTFFQEVAVTFANAWGSIMYTYHLYNAVRQEKLIDEKWKDMDFVMGLQDDGVFVGDRPTNVEDYFKRFALSMGYSASAFASNRRQGQLPESKRGPRGLQPLAAVAQMFKGRFWDGSGQVDLTLQDVETIISKSHWEMDENSLGEGLVELSLNRDSKPQRDGEKKAKEMKGRGQPMTAVELLSRLRNSLQGESLELNIDYLALHRMCWLLLRSVKNHCDDRLRDMYGAGYLERENQLPFTVGYIFMAATNSKKLSGLLAPKKKKGADGQMEVTSKLLWHSAGVVAAYIRESGTFLSRMISSEYGIEIADEEGEEDDSD